MTADALFVLFFIVVVFFYINKYAEFPGDQPVGQLCSSAMRTLAEKSVFLVDYSFLLSVLIH